MPQNCSLLDPYEAVAQYVSACPKLSLSEYLKACFGHRNVAPVIAAPFAAMESPITGKDLVAILCATGLFEPRGATEPRACDITTQFQKTVTVPPATTDAFGTVVPSTEKLIRICAPQGLSLVVHDLEALPANLTATESGEVFSKVMQVMGFSEMFCPPGEPGDGDDLGTFQNIKRVVLCPNSGFDLHARNHDTTSPALFTVRGEMWATP